MTRPRKPYRPKPVDTPITRGLLDTGVWTLTLPQIATVTAAAIKAEEVLPQLSVLDLYRSMQKLREVRAEMRQAA